MNSVIDILVQTLKLFSEGSRTHANDGAVEARIFLRQFRRREQALEKLPIKCRPLTVIIAKGLVVVWRVNRALEELVCQFDALADPVRGFFTWHYEFNWLGRRLWSGFSRHPGS